MRGKKCMSEGGAADDKAPPAPVPQLAPRTRRQITGRKALRINETRPGEREYKSGGKVEGCASKPRADRPKRKGA